MPYTLCVLGNSHTAAIKQAWDKYRPQVADGFKVRFFASSNGQLEKLSYRNGRFEPEEEKLKRKFFQTSGSEGPIDVSAYDGFFLVGLGFGIDATYWGGLFGTAEDARWGEVRELVSDTLFRALVRYRLRGSLGVRFAHDIHRTSKAPMLMTPVPFPSEHALDTKRAQKLPQLRERGYLGPFVARCRDVADRIMAEEGCEIVWQDEGTLALPGFTKKQFNLNAAVFGDRDDPDEMDMEHMNAEFGALTLGRALARFEALAPGRVLAPA